MLHFVAHAPKDRMLFHTWAEARILWNAVVDRVPLLVALCLMPDHLHLLTRGDANQPLGDGLRAYASWRNAARAEAGPVFERRPPPTVASGRVKEARDLRYIHLNPCRAQLVQDPLAWPFSTHRDAVGLAAVPARAAVADPHDLHHYVSADPHVSVDGTLLPLGRQAIERPEDLDLLVAAVSALARVPRAGLIRRSPARTLLVRSAVCLSTLPLPVLARHLDVSLGTLKRARRRGPGPQVRQVERVLGDPRFPALDSGDLRRLPTWRRFRWYR